jgi:hypothetical protein
MLLAQGGVPMKLIFSGLLVLSCHLYAGIVWDNGLPDGGPAFENPFGITAEPFYIGGLGVSIAAVRVWEQGPTGFVPDFPGPITYFIYRPDATGKPGLIVTTATAYAASAFFASISNQDIYTLEFNLHSNIAAFSLYWLGIKGIGWANHSLTGGPPNYISDLQFQLLEGGPWQPGISQQTLAFQLFDTPFSTPEPSTMTMLGTGVVLGLLALTLKTKLSRTIIPTGI